MAASIQDIVDDIRASARSNAERGSLFEQLMLGFLSTDTLFAGRFEKVWLWKDWPGSGAADTGIDLVAEERGGGTCAIQCKFYEPTPPDRQAGHRLLLHQPRARSPFTERIIVSTTDRWSAQRRGRDQGPADPGIADRHGGSGDSPVDWDIVLAADGREVELVPAQERKPLAHAPAEAIDDGLRRVRRRTTAAS